ncbi:MAG TPA: hypothetical protein VEY89_00740, partial [Candidatus Dormibacteraeota bacterium]|nr:hypothetical protein [Candidatus Dormibacteraeota bacterium]
MSNTRLLALVATSIALACAFANPLAATAFTDDGSHQVHFPTDSQLWGTHSLAIRSIENGLMSGTTECHPVSDGFISTLVTDEKTLGANTATVDMPYDDASGYTQCQPVDPR